MRCEDFTLAAKNADMSLKNADENANVKGGDFIWSNTETKIQVSILCGSQNSYIFKRRKFKAANILSNEYRIPEVSVRMYLEEVSYLISSNPIVNSSQMGELLYKKYASADREYMLAINLDNHNRPISYHILNLGSIDLVHFPIANVFKTAIIQNARSIILCHNHLSNMLEPSEEDLKATRRCVEIGNFLDLPVIDHFILGIYNYYSMRDHYPELFTEKGGNI